MGRESATYPFAYTNVLLGSYEKLVLCVLCAHTSSNTTLMHRMQSNGYVQVGKRKENMYLGFL